MSNVIAYAALTNKTMVHIMSLNNKIFCVVGISIFGFKTYWKQVLNLMETKTTPTFKQFLQAKAINAKKKFIISKIRCNKTERRPQKGIDKTKNLQEYNFKAKWDGL